MDASAPPWRWTLINKTAANPDIPTEANAYGARMLPELPKQVQPGRRHSYIVYTASTLMTLSSIPVCFCLPEMARRPRSNDRAYEAISERGRRGRNSVRCHTTCLKTTKPKGVQHRAVWNQSPRVHPHGRGDSVSTKESDEREDEALQRARGNVRAARLLWLLRQIRRHPERWTPYGSPTGRLQERKFNGGLMCQEEVQKIIQKCTIFIL